MYENIIAFIPNSIYNYKIHVVMPNSKIKHIRFIFIQIAYGNPLSVMAKDMGQLKNERFKFIVKLL